MLKEISEIVETIKVPIWEPFGVYKKLIGKKKNEKLVPGTVASDRQSIMQNLSVWVRGNLFMPDALKFWIKPAKKHLNKYLKEHKIDAICVYRASSYHAYDCAQCVKNDNIPWLADFRDPWSNIDFYHKLKLTNWADKKHKRLELALLNKANKVVTVSWSWAEDFLRISGKIPMVITNGYDPSDFVDAGKLALDEKFTITHAGSLNNDRNPHAFWKALAELCEDEGFYKDLEIKLIGQVAPVAIADLTKCGLLDKLKSVNNLPHNKVVEELMRSQLLLLPLNDTPNIDGVVPGKLYEYIGAKRPIVCIGKTTGDAAKIIQGTSSGKISGFKDVETLKATLKSYYDLYKTKALHINSKDYDRYSRKLLAGQITEELNKISN